MPRLHSWFHRLLGLFHKRRRDAELAEEIQQDLDLLTERNIAASMSPNEARNAALRQFGSVEQIKETAREQRVWMWADEFSRDVRFGVRMLERVLRAGPIGDANRSDYRASIRIVTRP